MSYDYTYPETQLQDFTQRIYNKPEFRRYMTYGRDDEKNVFFQESDSYALFPHQILLRNYISPYSPYDGLLLFHGTGTGKTCTAITIAEQFKEQVIRFGTKIQIITTERLKNVFMKELFTIDRGYKQCVRTDYKPDVYKAYIETLDEEGQKQLENKSKKMINKYYNFQTYENIKKIHDLDTYRRSDEEKDPQPDMTKILEERQMARLKEFSNTIIIVDEFHNYRTINKSSNEEQKHHVNKFRDSFLKLLKNATGSRVLLLSATPIIQRSDIVFIINIFRANRHIPVTGFRKINVNKFFSPKRNTNNKDAIKRSITKLLRGYVSYNPSQFEVKESIDENHTEIWNINRDNIFPYRLTPSIISKRHKTSIKGSEQLSLKSGILLEYKRKHKHFFHEEINYRIKQSPCSPGQRRIRDSDDPFLDSQENGISAKLHSILRLIQCAETEDRGKIFISISTVRNTLRYIKRLLNINGYEQYALDKGVKRVKDLGKRRLRYIVLSGSIDPFYKDSLNYDAKDPDSRGDQVNSKQMNDLVDLFNDKDNIEGDYIQIIIGSEIINEGITLKGIRQVHIYQINSLFSVTGIEQTVGRAFRAKSHEDLKSTQRNCKIYIHVTLYDHKDLNYFHNKNIDTSYNLQTVSQSYRLPFDDHIRSFLMDGYIVDYFNGNERPLKETSGHEYRNIKEILDGTVDRSHDSLVSVKKQILEDFEFQKYIHLDSAIIDYFNGNDTSLRNISTDEYDKIADELDAFRTNHIHYLYYPYDLYAYMRAYQKYRDTSYIIETLKAQAFDCPLNRKNTFHADCKKHKTTSDRSTNLISHYVLDIDYFIYELIQLFEKRQVYSIEKLLNYFKDNRPPYIKDLDVKKMLYFALEKMIPVPNKTVLNIFPYLIQNQDIGLGYLSRQGDSQIVRFRHLKTEKYQRYLREYRYQDMSHLSDYYSHLYVSQDIKRDQRTYEGFTDFLQKNKKNKKMKK